ncbi:MAG: erythromycin esterase family protein [Planctomycetota bacterium]
MVTFVQTLFLLGSTLAADDLIANGGFEDGIKGWRLINNSGRAELDVDRRTKRKGRQALHLQKTGGAPFDVVRGEVRELQGAERLRVSAFVKGRDVERAFLKFFLWDADEEPLNDAIDIRLLTGSFNWLEAKEEYVVPKEAKSATVMLVMVGEGEIWLDDVQVEKTAGGAPINQASANLVRNGGFEDGSLSDWQTIDNSGSLTANVVSKPAAEGRASLHVAKKGGAPFDVIRTEVARLSAGQKVRVSAKVRGKDLGRAFLKFFAYDDEDESLIEDVDIELLQGTFDWRPIERSWTLPKGTTRGSVMLVFVQGGELWLDDVRVEASGATEEPREKAQPSEPLDKRLSAWLDENAVPISLDFDAEPTDLQPLAEILADVRLVQLGEQTHGDGSTFAAKARLVKYLHEELGFDVIAFESGVYECERANRLFATDASIDDIMLSAIFGIWRVSEVRPLFEYIRKTHQTDRPLRLSGFDLRGSGAGAKELLPEIIAMLEDNDSVSEEDKAALAAMDAALNDGEYRPSATDRHSWRTALERLSQSFEEHADSLTEAHGQDEIDFLRWSLESYADREAFESENGLDAQGEWKSVNERDARMAKNLLWLLEERYPEQKVITWGATFHLMHGAGTIRKGGERFYKGCEPMGEAIDRSLRKKAYTIGFVSHHGRAGMPWAQKFDVPEPREDSLEDQLHRYGQPHLFLDLRGRGPFKRKLFASPLGYARDFEADWSKVVDGLVFIDEMRPSNGR